MIIIFEGTRKSGKTTTIQKLSEFCKGFNINVYRFYDREMLNVKGLDLRQASYVSCLQFINAAKAIEEVDKDAIITFDRFHVSEIVFGMHYRNYYSFEMSDIDKKLSHMDVTMLTFVSNTCERRMKKNEKSFMQDFINEHNYSSIGKKMLISLDETDGKISNEELEKILKYAKGETL